MDENTVKAVAWRNLIGGKWVYFDVSPQEVHDNGKPFEPVYSAETVAALQAQLAEEKKWAEHYLRSYNLAHDQAMSNGSALSALRARCEGLAGTFDQRGDDLDQGREKRIAWSLAAGELRALLENKEPLP